jgi:L-asparaginase II
MGRAFARLSVADEFLEIFDAMHAFPALVSGVDNVDAAIATQLDAVAKRGAAGAIGIGLRGRLGIAVKVWGGSGLIAGVAGLAALDQLGVLTPFARERLQRHSHPVVKGGGQAVGRFEPRLELRWQ